jgi:hypothetical protein
MRNASMQVPLRFLGNDHADVAIDDNDPLALLCEMEDRDDGAWDQINCFPSRCAMLSAWTGRIYRSMRED